MPVAAITRPPRLPRPQARVVAHALADEQEHVVSRQQLADLGVPRQLISSELRGRRWQEAGSQALVLHNGPLSLESRRWIAVFETGERAALDGVSALQQAGITGLDSDKVHVIAPKGSTPSHPRGVEVHESRRFREQDVLANGVRRTKPAVATIHAALWARTDKQARFFVIVVVQHRLTTPELLREALAEVRRDKRRAMLRRLVLEVAGGVQSLGELDIAGDFRRRGLPEPERQVVRKRASGTQYLDCALDEFQVAFEIDGVGHDAPEQRLSDLVRDITCAAEGRLVVRISLVAYALDREAVLDAIEELLVSRGWTRTPTTSALRHLAPA